MGATAGRLTFEEFERLPEDENEEKTELIDGELIRTPPRCSRHVRITDYIHELLKLSLRSLHAEDKAGELGEAFQEMGYRIGGNWVVPDVSITHAGQPEGDYFEGAPAIAVEIISKANTAELIQRKVRLYLENGALEVWVFYPRTASVAVYRGRNFFEVDDAVTTPLLPGLAIVLTDVFKPRETRG